MVRKTSGHPQVFKWHILYLRRPTNSQLSANYFTSYTQFQPSPSSISLRVPLWTISKASYHLSSLLEWFSCLSTESIPPTFAKRTLCASPTQQRRLYSLQP